MITLAAAWRGPVNGVATCATMRSESVTRQPVKAWPASISSAGDHREPRGGTNRLPTGDDRGLRRQI